MTALQTAADEGSFLANSPSGEGASKISDDCLLSLPIVQADLHDSQEPLSCAAISQEEDISQRDRLLDAQLSDQHR